MKVIFSFFFSKLKYDYEKNEELFPLIVIDVNIPADPFLNSEGT